MPGRKPRPIQTQINSGDPGRKGVRKLEQALEAEPKASKGLPPCPDHLKGRARDAWMFWSAELEAMDLDRRPDRQMLEAACIHYESAIDCYEIVQKQGRFIAKKAIDPETNKVVILDLKPHPAVRQGNQAWALMRSFCSEFGFSPTSRTRLAVERDDDGDVDLMELLTQPRAKRPAVIQ